MELANFANMVGYTMDVSLENVEIPLPEELIKECFDVVQSYTVTIAKVAAYLYGTADLTEEQIQEATLICALCARKGFEEPKDS
jgi:hypothetical protein